MIVGITVQQQKIVAADSCTDWTPEVPQTAATTINLLKCFHGQSFWRRHREKLSLSFSVPISSYWILYAMFANIEVMDFTAGLVVCWQLTRTHTAAMGTECDCSVILFHLSLPNNHSFGFSLVSFFSLLSDSSFRVSLRIIPLIFLGSRQTLAFVLKHTFILFGLRLFCFVFFLFFSRRREQRTALTLLHYCPAEKQQINKHKSKRAAGETLCLRQVSECFTPTVCPRLLTSELAFFLSRCLWISAAA